jgi:hypothetical protein
MSVLVKPVTWILGAVLLVMGILGFFMDSPLLGLFEVDLNHNIVHAVSGIVGLLTASQWGRARLFLIIFGLVYGAVAVIGLATGGVFDLIAINQADNFLHLGIAAACLVVGFGAKKP